MDWLQFISSVIGSLAWPLAAVALGFMFREQVRKLLDKMKSLKAPGGIEASFSEEVAKVAEETKQVVEAAPPEFDPIQGLDHPAPQEESDRLWALLKDRPAALIVDAWRDVEKVMLDLIATKGTYVKPIESKNPASWSRALERDGTIDTKTSHLIHELRTLRNRVAHARDWEPSVDDAMDYYRSAKTVTGVLGAVLSNLRKQQGNLDGE